MPSHLCVQKKPYFIIIDGKQYKKENGLPSNCYNSKIGTTSLTIDSSQNYRRGIVSESYQSGK